MVSAYLTLIIIIIIIITHQEQVQRTYRNMSYLTR